VHALQTLAGDCRKAAAESTSILQQREAFLRSAESYITLAAKLEAFEEQVKEPPRCEYSFPFATSDGRRRCCLRLGHLGAHVPERGRHA
jgi:hypothetical protein